MKRILVTGSRNWDKETTVWIELGQALGEMTTREKDEGNPDWRSPENYVLIHGDCPTGADHIADQVWRNYKLPVLARPALWSVWGRKAGPLRNQHMVDLGADLCLAFIMPGSKGAVDCMRRAEKAGIPIRWFTP